MKLSLVKYILLFCGVIPLLTSCESFLDKQETEDLTFEQLWTDCLKPLLEDYIQGMYDEEDIMEKLAEAYGYNELRKGNINEDTKG